MTDDELIERLSRTLRQEASTVTSPPDAWERYAEPGNVTAIGRARARRLWLGVPAGLIGAAALIALVVMVSGSGHRATSVAAGPRPASSAAAPTGAGGSGSAPQAAASGGVAAGAGASGAGAAAPSPVGPPGGPVPAGFRASSVTFVSASTGWVLGTAPCAKAPCSAVLRTADGGHSWVGIPAPPAAVTAVRFADPLNGWAWGDSLWSTHDGGATWGRVSLLAAPGSAVTALEASGGSVQAAIFDGNGHIRIESSPVGSDVWKLASVVLGAGAGPVPHTEVVLQGNTGWLVQVDRTVVAGARLVDGQWQAWTPPCSTVEGPAALAASSPTDFAAVCDVGEWSTPQGEHLFTSSDGGASFAASPVAVPVSGVSVVASPAPSTIVVAGGTGLEASFDGGHTWAKVAGGPPWADMGFTTASQGVAVSNGGVLMTHDGGHIWSPVSF